MSALLKIYDKMTSSSTISLGITSSALGLSLYRTYCCKKYFNTPPFIICTAAGIALALLAKSLLVHNNEVKTKGERNNVYATCSIVAGFPQWHTFPLFNNIHAYTVKLFASFGSYPHPTNIIYGISTGFLGTMLVSQLGDKK